MGPKQNPCFFMFSVLNFGGCVVLLLHYFSDGVVGSKLPTGYFLGLYSCLYCLMRSEIFFEDNPDPCELEVPTQSVKLGWGLVGSFQGMDV
jgi:prolipoprotein diacylglyceryltransferase